MRQLQGTCTTTILGKDSKKQQVHMYGKMLRLALNYENLMYINSLVNATFGSGKKLC